MADAPQQVDRPAPFTIISGGQTGVDRAALNVALNLSIPCGGWCPRGRLAADGVIDKKYLLRETPSEKYSQRTEYNIRDSDATLIIASEPLLGGTLLTRQLALQMNKPCLLIAPDQSDAAKSILTWLTAHRIRVLNVAGPRQTSAVDTEKQAEELLEEVFLRASSLRM